MQVEGKGLQRPAPVIQAITRPNLVEIERFEMQIQQRKSGGATPWQRGLIHNPHMIGKVAEVATQNFINAKFQNSCAVDMNVHYGGDKGFDLKPYGLKIEVKGQGKDYNPALVRRADDGGRMIPLTADVFVFVDCAIRTQPKLLGWITLRDLRKYGRFEKAPGGREHFNITVRLEYLKPMRRLLQLIGAYRSDRQCQ